MATRGTQPCKRSPLSSPHTGDPLKDRSIAATDPPSSVGWHPYTERLDRSALDGATVECEREQIEQVDSHGLGLEGRLIRVRVPTA